MATSTSRSARVSRGCGSALEPGLAGDDGRPSVLYATVTGEGDKIDSVEVAGRALIVAEGRFRITQA